jgi:phage terminase small subunit
MENLKDDSKFDRSAAPADLSESAREIWVGIYSSAEIDDAARLVLTELCRQHDRLRQAREVIAREGILVSGRYGKKTNPACGVERDSSAAMLRCWRLLGFDQCPIGQTMFRFDGEGQ